METVKTQPIFNLKKAYLFHSDVETKQLRSFGVIFFVFFFLVLGLGPLIFKGSPPRAWALAFGLVFLGVGLVAPRALRVAYSAWMVFGGILGYINTRILLSIVFFAILTPISVIRRLMGKDSLGLKFERGLKTYKTEIKADRTFNMQRQF